MGNTSWHCFIGRFDVFDTGPLTKSRNLWMLTNRFFSYLNQEGVPVP
jgi:hypothetical protein